MKKLVALLAISLLLSVVAIAYAQGPGMMGQCYNWRSPECQKFYDYTVQLRKQLHEKRFDYFEAFRNPKTTGEDITKIENEIEDLQEKLYLKAPVGCRW